MEQTEEVHAAHRTWRVRIGEISTWLTERGRKLIRFLHDVRKSMRDTRAFRLCVLILLLQAQRLRDVKRSPPN